MSPNGDDNNDGTGEETAFATIARALNVVRPGETIVVAAGTYEEGIELTGLGVTLQDKDNGDGTIVLMGADENDKPVLDGQGTTRMGFWCENCSNIEVSNLIFTNYTDIGIGFSGGSNLTMSGLEATDNGFAVQLTDWDFEGYGIFVENASDVLIENCQAYRNGPNPQGDIYMGTGINMYGCTDSIMRNNISNDNIGGGYLIEDSENILFENNVARRNDLDVSFDGWWDGGLWLDGGRDVTVRNNTFTDNLGPGIEISDEDLQNPTGYVLENNTSTGNYWGIFIWSFGTDDWPDEDIIRQSGNDFSGNSRGDVAIVPWESAP